MNNNITETEVSQMLWEIKEVPIAFSDDTNIQIADELVNRGLAEKTSEGYRLTKTGEKELMEKGGQVQPDKVDTIRMDVPLFIRTLEYAKEDAKTDMDLHKATENAINLSKTEKTLTMNNYDAIVNVDNKNNTQTCNCPHMYHEKLTQSQKENLGDKYLAVGSTVTDNRTGVVSDITEIQHTGFELLPQSTFQNAPKLPFNVSFEELVNKHQNGQISISGYGDSPEDHKILVLVVKDIIASNIIEKQSKEISEKDRIIDDLNDKIENEVEEEVELNPTMASGGIIGQVKATRSGSIQEVRDINGKILKQVYVGDVLYKKRPGYRVYFNDENEVLKRQDANRIHMAYGGIVGVEALPNFYRVDISSPKNVSTCRTPKWASHVAESVKRGAKVTVCKKYKKWWLSGVLVPKDGISASEAEHIGKEIKDKIEHKKMESGGRLFESGANSAKVNNLILFADNSGNLAEMKEAIYSTIKSRITKGGAPSKEDIKNRFKTFLMKAKGQYVRERGNTKEAKREVAFTEAEDDDFLNVYAEEAMLDNREISGSADIDYDRIRALKYWGELKPKQRLHFLLDHADYVFDKVISQIPKKELDEYKKFASAHWNKLPKEVQMAVEEHVIAGTYETGGELSGYSSPNGSQNEELIGDDVKSAVNGILVLIECADTEEEKERLRGQLKEYDYQSN